VRIGLLRHFPVTEKLPSGWRTAAELQAWRERYELAETPVGTFDVGGVDWHSCVSSDLPRARITARAVFRGEIEFTEMLREGYFAPFRTGRLRLPVKAWEWLLRLSWMTGHHSQRVCRDEFQRRVLAMADRLSAGQHDTLVVSHAAMMAYLSAELRRRGFAGPKLRRATHATVYIYQKNGSAPP
jgi:broad specificity phosphatase PhoE